MEEGAGKELAAFVDVLNALFGLRSKRPQGRLVLSFRKEWTPDIEQRLEEGKIRHENVFLERLKLQGIIEVVCGPVSSAALQEKYKITVEEDLPEIIAANLLEDRESPVAPTLSILLAKMWDEAKKKSPGAPVFGVELYRNLKDKGLLLSDFVDEQLEKIEEWNPEVAESGLALDVLFYHTTDQGTAETRTLEQVKAEYAHRQEVIEPLLKKCIETNLFFAARGEDDEGKEVPATRLAHDTLAPIIRKRHRESEHSGQLARKLVQVRADKWKEGKTGQVLDKDSLEEVEAGLNGMRVLREEESRLIEASHEKQNQIERERIVQMRRRRMQQVSVAAVILALMGVAYLMYVGNLRDVCKGMAEDDPERAWCNQCFDYKGKYITDGFEDHQFCQGADFESLIDRHDEDQFSLIPAATFMMGSDTLYVIGEDTLKTGSEEWPRHEVVIEEPYLMGRYEVTQAQWYDVMKSNPSATRGMNLPVTDVSWDSIQVFLAKLNELKECNDCYRLPTEAQWEYAACGGTGYPFGEGITIDNLGEFANYNVSEDIFSDGELQEVGQLDPTAFGLHDMLGNVWEWTLSGYEEYPYDASDGRNANDYDGPFRVLRGGSFGDGNNFVRCAYRDYDFPGSRVNDFGFRVIALPLP